MSQLSSIFQQSVAQSPSGVPGAPISMTPELNLSGLPGMRGPQGALLQMILQPLLQQALGPGFIPGQFAPTHNLFDHYRRRAEFQQMQQVMGSGVAQDQDTFVQFIRGMAALRGVQWNQDRERSAQIWASDMGRVSPMMAQMMPAMFDQIMGSRGSSTVMAQSVFAGGRYRPDPITGTMGLSSQSASALSREMFERLYGPGADLSATNGLGAGSIGQLFDEGARRGFLPRALRRDEQIRGMAERDLRSQGLGDAQVGQQLRGAMEELSALGSPQLEARIRQFEAGRIAERLRGLTGAVSAMRDVFGDMGRPDAPMSELIDGLQVLTQGGLATMSPGRLEQVVRDTHNMARRTGVGIDNMTAMMATGANQADAMRLDRSFGITSTQGAVNFGAAYAAEAGSPAWGRANRDRMTAIDQRLRLNAADSPVANQLAATVRLGGDVGFREGSEAAAMYQAVQSGRDTYDFGGQTRLVYDRNRWRDIMIAGGVNAQLATAYRSDTVYNQRTISEHNLMDVARGLQGRLDIAPVVGQAYRTGASQAGVTDQALLRQIQDNAYQALQSLSPEDLQDPAAAARALAGRLGVDPNDAARMSQLRLVATRGWGVLEQTRASSARLSGYRSNDEMLLANNERALQRGRSNAAEARIDSEFQRAMSAFGVGPIRRITDAVIGATPGTDIRTLASEALGWFPEGEVGAGMIPVLASLREQAAIYNTPGATAEVRQAAIARIRTFGTQFSRTADEAGIYRGGAVTAADAARVWQGARDRRGSFVEESDAITERMLNDDRSMSVLGEGGLDLIRRVQERNARIRELAGGHAEGNIDTLLSASAAMPGSSGETMSAGGFTFDISNPQAAGARAEALRLRDEQQRDLLLVQTRLQEGRVTPSETISIGGVSYDMPGDRQSALEAERARRRRSDSDVVGDLFRTLGVDRDVSDADRQGIIQTVMRGDRGRSIRAALPGLQRLREIARTQGAATDAQFQDYLQRGPAAGASEEERGLFSTVTAGQGGRGGFAGIGRNNLRAEDIRQRLEQFAPWQRDQPQAAPAGGQATPGGPMTINGTLEIVGNYGHLRGRSGGRA